MKKYIAFEGGNSKKWKYEYKIYRIKFNDLIYIWNGFIHYSSTRWPESEVMNKLIELWELPNQKEKYYISSRENKFKISYILPLNQK